MNHNVKVIIEPEVKITASGVSLKINNEEYVVQEINFDSLFITAKTGYISIYALKLLSLKHVSLTFNNLNGTTLYNVIPDYPIPDPDLRIRQYKAYFQNKQAIINYLIEEKFKCSNAILDKYGKPKIPLHLPENEFAAIYFSYFTSLLNDYGYDYYSRRGFYKNFAAKATNRVNALMNFYYGLIEHRLLNDIAYRGLDYQLSFLHIPRVWDTIPFSFPS